MRRSLVFLGFLIACRGEADLVTSECGGEPCPVCESDAECVIAHNACHPGATCGHVDEQLAVTMEGCSAALEYDRPPASDCSCQAERCMAAE